MNLEDGFHQEVLEICCEETKELGYDSSGLRRMVMRWGGLGAAKRLLRRGVGTSYGLLRLRDAGLLEFSVEALTLREPWSDLFTPKELAEAQRRLDESYGLGESPVVSEQDQVYGYMLRDREGDTVYVGVTNNPRARRAEHRLDRKEFKSMEVELGPVSREKAEAWETCTIESYRFFTGRNPRYNRTRDGKWGS